MPDSPLPQIELIPTNTIKPNPGNPRIIKDEKFIKLVQSIKAFPEMLNLRPVVLDGPETRIILGGNMRWRAAKEAGIKSVPAIYADKLTPEQQQEFIIKDNLSYGEWDWEIIAAEFSTEQLEEWGLDLPDFNDPETREPKEDNFEISDLDKLQTDIKAGDIFDIGPHRLMCGDSTIASDVHNLMKEDRADLIFTDPPYGVSYTGAQNDTAKRWDMIKNDDLRGDSLVRFLFLAFQNAYNFSKRDIAAYVWYASKTHIQFEEALKAAAFEVSQQLIWNKGMSLGHADYHWAHEPVLYCKKIGQTKPWYGDRTHKTILGQKRSELTSLKKEELVQIVKNLLDASTNWEIDRETVTTYKHPTQKPVPLAGRAILNSSQEDDIVLDLFGGSGTTMVACAQLGRKGRLMEMDPKFCQVIVDRMLHNFPELEVYKNGKKQ